MSRQPTVFIVDDDGALRDSLQLLMWSADLPAETFASANEFLERVPSDWPGCLVLDVRMPEVDGLALQRQLAARSSRRPVIMMSGHGDVPTAVESLRAGALDFIQKPFDSHALLDRIREALKVDAQIRNQAQDLADLTARFTLLSPREIVVAKLVIEGLSTKQIAASLKRSFDTVQNQRTSILKKMRAISTADLVRMIMIVAPDWWKAR